MKKNRRKKTVIGEGKESGGSLGEEFHAKGEASGRLGGDSIRHKTLEKKKGGHMSALQKAQVRRMGLPLCPRLCKKVNHQS